MSAHPISRRAFLCGATLAAPFSWFGLRRRSDPAPSKSDIADGMPGPFPARVVEVHHPGSVRPDRTIDAGAVQSMVARGMADLAGSDDAAGAWRRLFGPGDVVGIKVNPVGRAYSKRQIPAVSSPALVVAVVEGLKQAGVHPRNIFLFDRYADQFREAGYDDLLRSRPLEGVRWFAGSARFDNLQVDLDGHPDRRDTDPRVLGYDPDVFFQAGYCRPDHDPKDDRRFRSHLALVVSRLVNKVINLPVLKDHGSAGVTLALKNLSHGLFNNVARSHLGMVSRGESASGPNQCNTFIPTAVGNPLVRQKVVLHILDGLNAVYEGGPASRLTWPYRSLLFATDPVALDRVGWDIVDAKRRREGWPTVDRAGFQSDVLGLRAAAVLAPLAARGAVGGLPLLAARETSPTVRQFKEVFDRRQPEHIILAGTIGLGTFDSQAIRHRRVVLGS